MGESCEQVIAKPNKTIITPIDGLINEYLNFLTITEKLIDAEVDAIYDAVAQIRRKIVRNYFYIFSKPDSRLMTQKRSYEVDSPISAYLKFPL